MPHLPTFAAEVAALNERVTNIEGGLRTIAEAVTALGAKMDSGSRTNWQPIWAALGVMTSILGLMGAVVYMPIKEAQMRVERDIVAVEQRTREGDAALRADIVPRREQELFLKQYDRSIERLVTRIDRLEYGHGKVEK
jgi:hypothetical protein